MSYEKCMSDIEDNQTMPIIDPALEKFPYCIVWTPIPCITWFLPFIGKLLLVPSVPFVWKNYKLLHLQATPESETVKVLSMTLPAHIISTLEVFPLEEQRDTFS